MFLLRVGYVFTLYPHNHLVTLHLWVPHINFSYVYCYTYRITELDQDPFMVVLLKSNLSLLTLCTESLGYRTDMGAPP